MIADLYILGGRGTAAPFRIIGGLSMDAERIVKEFSALKLAGVVATPVYFMPTTSKHQGIQCGGMMLHVTNDETLWPVELGIELLALFQRLYPEDSLFLPPAEPERKSFISQLTGCGDFVSGWDKDKILYRWKEESAAFAKEKQVYHLYERA